MIAETRIQSLADFATFVAGKASEGKPYWYRGTRVADVHDLIPSLYRHPTRTKPDDLRELEGELMALFADRAPPFTSNIPANPMDLLFFMQHHGVPTRLLDWSENPYVALFFALEVALWEKDDEARESAVWMLDPIALNKIAFANNAGNDRVLSAKDDLLNAYRPNSPTKTSGKFPIAIYGIHNSSRIVAQRGIFVLFGATTVAMNKEETLVAADGLMHKIVIERGVKKAIASALFNSGVTDSVIYPDLDGLGREIKNRSGFWGAPA